MINSEQTYRLNQKDSNYSPVRVNQVKEKFGGLRFYWSGGNDVIAGLVAFAEAMSMQICEICGDKGETDWKKPWVKTLCEKHKKAT